MSFLDSPPSKGTTNRVTAKSDAIKCRLKSAYLPKKILKKFLAKKYTTVNYMERGTTFTFDTFDKSQ